MNRRKQNRISEDTKVFYRSKEKIMSDWGSTAKRTCDPKYKFIGETYWMTGLDESTIQALSGEQSQNRQNSTDLHLKNAPRHVYWSLLSCPSQDCRTNSFRCSCQNMNCSVVQSTVIAVKIFSLSSSFKFHNLSSLTRSPFPFFLSFFFCSSQTFLSMEDNRIYFNARFKSFDITRLSDSKESYYDWVERSCNMMRQSNISTRIMPWIGNILKEASKEKTN